MWVYFVFVFKHTSEQISRRTDVKRTHFVACHDVNIRMFFHGNDVNN